VSGEQPTVYREEDLRRALATDPRVNEMELSVRIVGDRVVVSGVVATEERRAAIGDVVAELAPDLAVDNRSSVLTASTPSEERLQ
jgi:hypothetical protein